MEIKLCACSNCYYKEIDYSSLKDKVVFKKCGCLGYCGFGPVGIVSLNSSSKILHITKEIIEKIIENPSYFDELQSLRFNKENKILMKYNDVIDPEDIDSYISVQGFKAFEKALSMGSEEIIKEIELSGLRGRGGAAFPTYKKLQALKEINDYPKYIVANLEEGEIASFNNTILAESNPFSIIEGMMIAALATSASKGYIFVNYKAKIAIQRLKNAINQVRSRGYFNEINFDIEIRRSPSSYIAGEESAMLEVLEGKKAFPRNKPPFPVHKGLYKKPTLINNVETLAAIPYIILNSHSYYTSFGKPNSFGTKMISLTGNVNNPCVNEVPFGVTMREIMDNIGMGYKEDNKGFLIGGPSGGIVSNSFENIPYTYEDISSIGAMVGSGGIYAIPNSLSIPTLVKFLIQFFADESCGQCIPCRVGTVKLTEILNDFIKTQKLPSNLQEMSNFIMDVSLCGLGQAAPIPLLTALKNFANEFNLTENDLKILNVK